MRPASSSARCGACSPRKVPGPVAATEVVATLQHFDRIRPRYRGRVFSNDARFDSFSSNRLRLGADSRHANSGCRKSR